MEKQETETPVEEFGANPVAKRAAYQTALSRIKVGKQYGVDENTTEEQLQTLAVQFAKQKAERDGGDWKQYLDGQLWYVADIHRHMVQPAKDVLHENYINALADVPDADDEMAEAIDALRA